MKGFTKKELKDRISNMTWSFSRLNGFSTCKRMWFLTYVLTQDEQNKYNIHQADKFFGLYGSFAHSIFEKYNKGELEIWQLYDYCKDNYDAEIPVEAPPNKYVDIYESYRDKLLNYFKEYKGNDKEVVFSEKKIEFEIPITQKKKISFIGFIDLLLRDKDGKLIIQDYKSKSDFKNEKEHKEYLRQLLLYARGVYKIFHKYPKELSFDMFKIGKTYTTKFDKQELEDTLKWVKDTYKEILKEQEFECMCEKPSDNFFCNYVCGYGSEMCNRISEQLKGGEIVAINK